MVEELLGEQGLQLLDHFFDGVYVVDVNRTIVFWNKSAERITGYSKEETLGSSCADNLLRHVNAKGMALCENGCPLLGTISDGVPRVADVYLHHKAGHRVPVQVRSSPLIGRDGRICAVVEIFTDNSRYEDMFRQLREIQRKLYQDELTGVGNRKFADLRMSELLGAYKDHGQPFGILFVDIDHFKRVNDTYGHAIGDEVIRMVARTIQNGLRPTDRVCRFGGEEFVCLLPGVDREGLRLVAERARMLVEMSWLDTELGALRVTVSLGGSEARSGDTADQILQRADRNMYWAKESGRNRVVVDEE